MSENKGNVIYSKPNCGGCVLVENWFKENGVEYTKIDVTQDRKAMEKVQNAGYMSLPLVEKDGDFVLNEFQPEILGDLFL